MIFYLLFIYLLSESMATYNTDDSAMTDMFRSILCYYNGQYSECNPDLKDLPANDIPDKCDYVQFIKFSIDQTSFIRVKQEILDSLIALKKQIILPIYREEFYTGWTPILGPDGNENETKVLCDFATKNGIKGYTLFDLYPGCNEALNTNIGKYIIPYIKQLKKLCPSNFIIGLSVSAVPEVLKNTEIYNFGELNDLVTYYEIDTETLNVCNPKLYNGETPITKSEPGENYRYGLEEVVSNLKETEINFNKLVFIISIIVSTTEKSYTGYTEICGIKLDNATVCVQTSQNYYDKGKFFHDLTAGIQVKSVDWDDYSNICECQSAFNGFYNIYAGYTNGKVIPCAKFDVQSTVYPIK